MSISAATDVCRRTGVGPCLRVCSTVPSRARVENLAVPVRLVAVRHVESVECADARDAAAGEYLLR